MYVLSNAENSTDSSAMDKMNGNIGEKRNFSVFIATEFTEISDPDYEEFLADIWVGIVLTLLVLSCVCCMCSCLLYHKFQQWKRHVLEARQRADMENGGFCPDFDTLPSYTIASGLPTYDEALEQYRKVKQKQQQPDSSPCLSSPHRLSVHRLSVTELFQFYMNSTPSNTNPVKS